MFLFLTEVTVVLAGSDWRSYANPHFRRVLTPCIIHISSTYDLPLTDRTRLVFYLSEVYFYQAKNQSRYNRVRSSINFAWSFRFGSLACEWSRLAGYMKKPCSLMLNTTLMKLQCCYRTKNNAAQGITVCSGLFSTRNTVAYIMSGIQSHYTSHYYYDYRWQMELCVRTPIIIWPGY